MGNSSESFPGRNMYLGVGIQSGVGSSATVYSFMQPSEVTGGLEEFAMIDSARRLSTRFKGTGYVGTKQVPLGFTVEASPQAVGRLLKLAFGAEIASSVVAGVYGRHKYYPSEELPYGTILLYAAGVADETGIDKTIKVTDWKCTKLTIKGGVDDIVTLQVEGIGAARTAVYPSSYTTPTFTTVQPLFMNSAVGTGVLLIGTSEATPTVAFEEARSFEITIEHGVKADHRIHGSNAAIAMREGDSSITGTYSAVYNGVSFGEINKFQAGTARAMKLSITSVEAIGPATSETYDMIVETLRSKYSGGNPSWDADQITVELPFTAELASSQAVTVTILNNVTSEYTYSV